MQEYIQAHKLVVEISEENYLGLGFMINRDDRYKWDMGDRFEVQETRGKIQYMGLHLKINIPFELKINTQVIISNNNFFTKRKRVNL